MAGSRLPLLFTLMLLLTPLSLADTSTQTAYGENSTDKTVQAAKHGDGTGDGGGGGGDDGGGMERDDQSQNGVLGSATTALWEKLRPYVVGECADDFAGLQAAIRQRLLKVAEEEVSLYSRAAAYTWPDDHSRPGNRTQTAAAAGDEDSSDDDVGGDVDSYVLHNDDGDENPCGHGDCCDSNDDVRRSKRDHPPERPQIHDVRGTVLLERVEGILSLGTWGSLGVHVTQWHDRLILAVLDANMSVTLHAVSPGTLEVASSPSFPGLHSCGFTVVPVDLLLVACISPNRSSAVQDMQQVSAREVAVYVVSEETFGAGKLAVKHQQSIEVESPIDLELWSRGHESYLLIANAEEAVEAYSSWGEELTNRTTYHTSSLLYHWKEHYFDALQQRVLPGTNPHAVTHFTIDRYHFVAMANFQNNKGQHNIDSYIFQYSLEEEHLVLFQRLATKGARHFASFTLGRHPFVDTFLVVANFCEDDEGGACNPYTRSSIYRFARRKFVLFQEVATAHAVQWQAVQVEDTVLLAVAQVAEGVRLFQYDGWRFVAAPVQHYEGRFGPGVMGLAAARWNGTFIFAVSNREPENSLSRPPDVFEFTFRENTWLQKAHREHHAWCEAARGEMVRVGDLASLIQQVQTAPITSHPHVFTRYATIRGHLTVLRSSSATQVFEGRTGMRVPVMLDSFTQTLVTLEREVERMAARLPQVVSLTSTDLWPELHLAHLSAGWASADHVEAQQVNQRPISFKDAVTLDEAGAQHLAGLRLIHVEIQTPARITMLAGDPFSSYVTLSGRHTLHGHVTFPANVTSAGLVAVTVDGIHITRKSVLTSNEYQYVTGFLTCQHLSTDSMQVVTINSIPLSPLLSTLVFRDGRHTVSGLVRVMGDLAYYGNLKINLTTHLDLENPLRTDYTGLQVISGDHQVSGLATQTMAVEGRVNAVRVPAGVFLNGSQYSYAVPSAAFSHVRAASLSVTQALGTITVTDGRLDVLLKTGDQQVTAPKNLLSLHVLRRDSSGVGARRRRWSSETCGSRKAWKPMTPRDRSEALLVALRGVAAAQHLLSFLVEAPQGILLVPGHNGDKFFKLLTQNVACAITSLEDDSCLKLHNILQEVKWINSTTQDETVWSSETTLEIRNNVKAYIVKKEMELRNINLSANDFLMIRDVTGRNILTRQDVLILNSLISVARNHELHHLPPDIMFNNCMIVCPETRENMPARKNLQETCTPNITPIFKALRSMSRYSSIIRAIWHLSTHHFWMLETGVIHHLLGQLLQTVREQKHLRRQIYAAAVCGVSPEGGKESLQMLIKYRQELYREAAILLVGRTKREAPVGSVEVTKTTNGSSTNDSVSTNENTNTSPSSTAGDPITSIKNSATFPSSTTEYPTTSTEDPTSSLASTTQRITISNENSPTSPSSTTDGPIMPSEDSTTTPSSTTGDPTTSTDGTTTHPSSATDGLIIYSEDSSTTPSSTTRDLTTSNEGSTTCSSSTTDGQIDSSKDSTTSPFTTAIDWTISSENSTTSAAPITEDTTISIENLTISPSSTTGISTSFSEEATTFPSPIAEAEDSVLSSNDSDTTSAITTQNTTDSSDNLSASSSSHDKTTIHGENSTTSSSSTTKKKTISIEISTTSSLSTEDPAISSENSTSFLPSTTFPSSTTEDATISSDKSTTFLASTTSQSSITSPSSTTENVTISREDSTASPSFTTKDPSIPSEIPTTLSSTTEGSTISSEISTTSSFPTDDSTNSSEILTTSSLPGKDSTISSEISTTLSSTTEDSTIPSEISTTLLSTTEDSTISSEISITLSFPTEDSTISSERSTTSSFPTEDSTISSEISTTSSSVIEDLTISSEISTTSSSAIAYSTISSEIPTTSSSITEDSTISSKISTTSSSITEDSTISSEISTTSSSITEDSTISSEISTTSSFPANDSTISSDISTTSSSITEDSTISCVISTTSSSTTEDSTISSEISTTSSSTTEDSTISSEISTTSSSTTEDSTISSEISTTSSSITEDSTISSEISTTSSSTTEDSTISSEISTTSSSTTEDSTISSEISTTSSSTTEDSTISSEISTTSSSITEDSTISSEFSSTFFSTTEDTTISSEILTTSSFPTNDSTISSEISTTSSSSTDDSTISDEISPTLFSTTEDSSTSSVISTTLFSTTEDSSTSSEISPTLFSTTEDSSISSEISTTLFFIDEDSTISSEVSTTSSSTSEDTLISSEKSFVFPFSIIYSPSISSENSTTSPFSTIGDLTVSGENSSISSFTIGDTDDPSDNSRTSPSSTIQDITISATNSTTVSSSTIRDATASSENSISSTLLTTDGLLIVSENSTTSTSPVTKDSAITSEISTISSSTLVNPTTFIMNPTVPLTSITKDSTTSQTSSPDYSTTSTSLAPFDVILGRSRDSFLSGSEGETPNGDSNGNVNELFNAIKNLTTTRPTEVATRLTDASVTEDDIGSFDINAIKDLATIRPAEETTHLTTNVFEDTQENEDNNGDSDTLSESKNQTTTRPAEVSTLLTIDVSEGTVNESSNGGLFLGAIKDLATTLLAEVTTLITTDVSEGTVTEGSNGGLFLGAIKDLATTRPEEVPTHKTDAFIEDTTHITTDTTETTTHRMPEPVQDTTPCIDCPVSESNSSDDTDSNVLSEVLKYITSTNLAPCLECNVVKTDASVDESATVVAGIQGLRTTLGEDTTPTDTVVDGSTQIITTHPSEETSHDVTTQTSTASSVGILSSAGGATPHVTTETIMPAVVSQDITCAIITESPATDPEEPVEVMIKFSAVNNTMEVRRSVTKADPILVPLSISLNYDNCSSLSLVLLQDSDHLMFLYPRLQMTSHYLFTVIQSQVNFDSTETQEYDVGLEGSVFDAFGFIIDTLKKLVLGPMKFLETLDSERLQSDFEFLDFVLNFASSSHYHYWSNRLRYRALYLQRLLDISKRIVDKLLNCFESLSLAVSTSVTETTTEYFVDPGEMPEIMQDLERQLLSNEELIKGLTILLNFTREVQTLNPYLNPRCPSPHTIDHEFVANAVEEARTTLDAILADELLFVSESNSSVLTNQLLQLRDAMQLCLMVDKLAPEMEAYLSLIYNKNGSPIARDSEKLLSVRIYYLLRATHGLMDYMNAIAEEHAIKHEVTRYPTETPVPFTDWDRDGLWLVGRLEGFSISQLVEDARLQPTLPLHEEYTANFDPASSSYTNFIAEHREKVRHLVFQAGLSTVSVQGHGVMRVLHHALALTTTPTSSFTFTASVTVVGPVRASVINRTPAAAFVTLSGQRVLSPPFVFKGSVTAAAHVRVRGEVNGVDLALLSRSVAVTSPTASQTLLQPVTFAVVSSSDVVFARGRVRDVPLGDLVRLDQPAAITGSKTFTELMVRLGRTRVANLTAQYISGVNVTDLFFNSLTTNPGGRQVVTGALHLRHLVVQRNVTTHRLVYVDPLGTAHTLNLPSLSSRVVPLHGDTILTGSLNFTGVVYVSALIFRDSFDGVSASQFRDGWLMRAGDQDIPGPVSFLNVTAYKATVLHGATLQGVDLARLFSATFLTSQPVTLRATLTFRQPVWAAWTTVEGLVQGWDLGTHAVLQHSSGVVFTAAKTFLGNVYVSGVIMSGSRTDHCPYFPIRNFTIQGQVVANIALYAGSAVVSGHEVTAEAATRYWLADKDTKVAVSTLNMAKLNHSTATTVNGMDLQRLRSGLVQKNCDAAVVQKLMGTYTFSSLDVGALYTSAINSSFINGEPSNSLQQVLFSGGTQVFTGHPTFASLHSKGSVVTSKAVNDGLKGSQLCRHSQRCVVRTPKTFQQDLVILGNLTVQENRLVQGVDVSRALQSWVPHNSCGYIPGLTTITGNLIVASTPSIISVGGLVDGVEVTSRHVMTRTGRQTMTKTILIHQPHSVALESPAGLTALDGLFNGYNLSDAWRRAFLSNTSVVVKAPVVFKKVVVFRDSVSLSPQDSAPLPSFGDFKPFLRDFARLHSLSVLSEWALLDRVREYWGWRVVQELDEDLERLVPLSVGTAAARPLSTAALPPKHHLGLLSEGGSVPVLQREPHTDRYTHSGVVLAGRCASGLVSYASEGRSFLVTTHACLDDHTAAPRNHPDITTSATPTRETEENLHVWEVTPQGAVLRSVIGVPGAVDIQVVWPEDGEVACLVVVEARGTDVVVVCERQAGVFVEHQRLNLTNPTKVSAAQHTSPVGSSGLTLAVADPGRTALKGGGISLFQYDKRRGEFYLLQEELLEDAVWVELVSRGADLLLVAVTEDHQAGLRAGRVCIYRVDWYSLDGLTPLGHRGRLVKSATPSPRVVRLPLTPQLFPVQELPIETPSEARFLAVPSGGLHLYVISHSGLVTWFSQKGIQMFRKEGELRVLRRLTLEVWAVAGGEWAPRMSLAGGRCPRGSHEAPYLPTLVLEMMFRGGNVTVTTP